MHCAEARELLEEDRRGELNVEMRQALRAHLAECDACHRLREETDRLAALIRTLPRQTAPATLVRAVRATAGPRRGPAAWLTRPWVAAAVAAALVLAVLVPWLQFRGRPADDRLESLVQGVVAEHVRMRLQLEGMAPQVSDPRPAFARVRALTDLELPRVLAGNDELTLLDARPTIIAGRTAAAVMLRDARSFTTSYFALHGQDLPMPSEGRVQIEQYRPYMRRVGRFNIVYWKQGEYAWLMVSDLDDPGTRRLFAQMRKAL